MRLPRCKEGSKQRQVATAVKYIHVRYDDSKTRSGAGTIGYQWPISDGQTALAYASTIGKNKTSIHLRSLTCCNAMDTKLRRFYVFNLDCLMVGVCNVSVFPRNSSSRTIGSDVGKSWGEVAAAGEGCPAGLVIVVSHQAS